MPKKLREQFSNWLAERQGQRLIHLERKLLQRLLKRFSAREGLLLGDSQQAHLFDKLGIDSLTVVYPLRSSQPCSRYICSDMEALPIRPESMDLVVMPHILQFSQAPFHILREVQLVLKSEGHLVMIGFNPFSLWGLCKLFCRRPPYLGQFHSPLQVKAWLDELDFIFLQQESYCLIPTLNEKLGRSLFLFEQLNRLFFSIFGGIYVTVAKKQTINFLVDLPNWQTQAGAFKDGVIKPAGGV